MPEQVLTELARDGGATKGGTVLTAGVDHVLAPENHSRDRLIVSVGVADAWLSYGTDAAVVGSGHCVRSGAVPFEESQWPGEVHIISAGAAVVGVTETSFELGDDEGERPTGADTFTPHGPSDTPIAAPTAPPPGTPIT